MALPLLFHSFLMTFAITFALFHVNSQPPDQKGFINLDCGLSEIEGYTDKITGLYYTTDESYMNGSGEARTISPEFKSPSILQQYFTLRSFPGKRGTRYCYKLWPIYGQGNKILLRARFLYGNYDSQNKAPEFDLHLGVNYWDTIAFKDSSPTSLKEIIHIPTSDHISVCVVNTGRGTPFISAIELRPMGNLYNTTSGSLRLFERRFTGSIPNIPGVRYPDDPYDRRWLPSALPNSSYLVSNTTDILSNEFNVPPIIMRTAAMAKDVNYSLNIFFSTDNASDQFHLYLHFAQLVINRFTNMSIYVNGVETHGPTLLYYKGLGTINSVRPLDTKPENEIIINSTADSTLPPILNAFEIYTVIQMPNYETYENDVSAINTIKQAYGITQNWLGDPCSPSEFIWVGVNCTYNGFEPPRITSMNLSSTGLTGPISPAIYNLTLLQSLDLSHNHLTGPVPDFLSRMSSLKFLNLAGNNFTGPLPQELLMKANNGSLTLISDGVEIKVNDTEPPRTNKKSMPTVPIVGSLVGAILFVVIILALLYWVLARRKRKDHQTHVIAKSTERSVSLVESRLRRFTFSEVKSMVHDGRILGEGGFGVVYHGSINGTEVAVKLLRVSPEQEYKDFQAEVNILATVHHKNLTSIIGYMDEGTNKGIICEFIENGNLKNHLSVKNPNALSWERRIVILSDVAEGLEYLHHGCKPPIIHRDINTSNILLTKDYKAKLADFGVSRTSAVNTTRVVGTPGYHDPQYMEPHMMTDKIDIYSFGVVMFEVVTGRHAIMSGRTHITQWIIPMIEKADIQSIVDHRLEGQYNVNVAWRIIELAMSCVSPDSSSRPNMNYIVKELRECSASAKAGHGHEGTNSYIPTGPTPPEGSSVFKPYAR